MGEMCIANENISSLVIDKLSDGIDGDSVSVVFLYCSFQAQKSEFTTHMLGSLLEQVIGGLEVIPAEIDRAFRKANQGFDRPGLSVSEILKLLSIALKSRKRTFICIDALDECVIEHRPEFLRSLYSIVRDSPNVRLFVTGRPHIQAELVKHHRGVLRVVVFKPAKTDIEIYLERKLQDDSFHGGMDSELQQDIMQLIPEVISEMYVNKPVLTRPGH